MISNTKIEKKLDEHLGNFEHYLNEIELEVIKDDKMNVSNLSMLFGKLQAEYKGVMFFRKESKEKPQRAKRT